jgi:hypothetical protein
MAVCRVSLGLPPVPSRSPPYIDIKLAFSDASLESGSGFAAEAIPCGDDPDNSALALLITLALALAKAENLVPSNPSGFLFEPALPNEWLIALETEDLDILHVFVELEFIELESLRDEDS